MTFSRNNKNVVNPIIAQNVLFSCIWQIWLQWEATNKDHSLAVVITHYSLLIVERQTKYLLIDGNNFNAKINGASRLE